MHLGNRIRKIRILKGFSREYIYNGIVSNSHYSNIEKGRFQPPLEVLKLLAERLEVPVLYLSNLYEEDEQIERIIKAIVQYIKDYKLKEAKELLAQHEKQLTYVFSIWQELEINFVRFDLFIKFHQYKDAERLFDQEIQNMIHIQDVPPEYRYQYFKTYGTYYLMKRDFHESLRHYERALNYANTIEDEIPIHYNLAICYYNLNTLEKACDYLEKALHYELHTQNWISAVHSYNLFGVLFHEKKDYKEAEKYYKYGIALSDLIQLKEVLVIGKLYHNLGLIYFEQGIYEEAEKILLYCIELRENGAETDLAKTVYLLIQTYVKQQKIGQARALLDKHEAIIPYALQVFSLAKIAHQQEEYESFEENIVQAIQCFEKEAEDVYLLEALDYYIAYLEGKRKYKQSYELLVKYVNVKNKGG